MSTTRTYPEILSPQVTRVTPAAKEVEAVESMLKLTRASQEDVGQVTG